MGTSSLLSLLSWSSNEPLSASRLSSNSLLLSVDIWPADDGGGPGILFPDPGPARFGPDLGALSFDELGG
jgi:hypothetical protein